MAVLLGKDAKTYYSETALDGETNTVANVEWVEVTNLQDETDNFSAEEIDVTTRATAQVGWAQTLRTINNAEITFTILIEPGDTLCDLLLDAFFNKTLVTMLFLSGDVDVEGNFGLGANWSVSMSFAKPVKGAQTADVSLKVAGDVENVTTTGA